MAEDNLDSCFDEEAGGGGGESGDGDGSETTTTTTTKDEVDPAVVHSSGGGSVEDDLSSAGEGREQWRDFQSSTNFMTVDKTVQSPASAVSRKKYMIRQTHFIDVDALYAMKHERHPISNFNTSGKFVHRARHRKPYEV